MTSTVPPSSSATTGQTTTSASVTQQLTDDVNKIMDDTYSNPIWKIDSTLFECLQDIDLDRIKGKDLTVALPFIVKLLLNPFFTQRRRALELIFHMKKANDVIQSLQARSVEPQDLNPPSPFIPNPALFESTNPDERLKIIALEYIRIQDIARQANLNSNSAAKLQTSVLFDNELYIDDITICLFALLNKPTTISVINILDVSEALLHLKYGPTIIVRLVLNMPERCQEVCHSMINFGEKQDECEKVNEISDQRAKTLRAICQLDPSLAFTVRSLTLQMGKMPSLTIMVTLDRLVKSLENYNNVIASQESGVYDGTAENRLAQAVKDLEANYDSSIAFITGILMGVDESIKSWFAQYIKSAQQKRIDQSHHTVLSTFRSTLLIYIQKLFPCFLETEISDEKSIDTFRLDKSETPDRFMNRKLIQATATLRVYCALRGIGMLKLNHEESETLLRLVTCRQVANQTSINLATTGVCTLLVCSSVINNLKDERRAAEWLKWLIKESHYSDDSFTSHGKCSISELLLLIAIHFQNNENNQIAELVQATLGLKMQTRASVSKCKSLFVQEVFYDQMIAEHAVRVPVTRGLDNTTKEFLPIHCIHQLLECRSFSKHQVPIEEWILRQICESKKPIHHMLPELISAYTNSLFISTSSFGHCGTNHPIPESDIMKVFQTKLYCLDLNQKKFKVSSNNEKKSPTSENKRKKSKKEKLEMENQPMEVSDDAMTVELNDESNEMTIIDVEVAQILLLYYLMLYEDVRMKKGWDPVSDKMKTVNYSPDIMMDIPVFFLLQLVRDNQDQFGTILPPLLRLVATQYPHLCSIQHWLNTTEHYETYKSLDVTSTISSRTGSDSVSVKISTPDRLSSKGKRSEDDDAKSSREEIKNHLLRGYDTIHEEPWRLSKTISSILMMNRNEIWTYVDIFINNWTKVLHSKCHEDNSELIQLTTKLWWKFNAICPRKLWVMTIDSLRMVQNGIKIGSIKSLEYTWEELVADPLIVLRCDNRIFRSPEYLNILLHILNAFLAASRRCLQCHISEQSYRQKEVLPDILEELKTTLVLAQTSAAIQILLESCLPFEEELELLDKKENDVELSEVERFILHRFDSSVSCICEHLHQVFIADTNLAKLVHFQTYPSALLATTSEKIPSMHICLDFIPELLSQPDLSKQVFVIELTSHLCEKYAITKSLNVAKLCFNVAYTLLQLLPSDKKAHFYIPALPALLRICRVFPILQEDTRIILNQINQITLAHMASTSSRLSLGTAKPFEGLDKVAWVDVKKQMSSLTSDEALYLCIQKCLLDLDRMEEKEKQQLKNLSY